MPDQNIDPELNAIQQMVQALEPLEPAVRKRVVAYVFERLGLSEPNQTAARTELPPPSIVAPPPASPLHQDIRSLKEAKQPKSDNQMAALVAYYLKEVVPENDRRDTISHEDINRFFKQAGYPLPKLINKPLNNAKSAGYFDSAGVGQFKLNPVGHNLVVHGMPSSSADITRRVKKPNQTKERQK